MAHVRFIAGDSDTSSAYGSSVAWDELDRSDGGSPAGDFGPAWSSDEERIAAALADSLSPRSPDPEPLSAALATPCVTGASTHEAYPDLTPRRSARVAARTWDPVPIAYDEPAAAPGAPRASEPAPEDQPDLPSRTAPEPFTLMPAARRPPLHAFRGARALSVTDLVQPAWCELQFARALSSPRGKLRSTLAMAAGSAVHRALEAEVSARVAVRVSGARDRFGLRVWNAVQGLRALRDGGIARELEVWGVVEGVAVAGVIDELTYICPDADLERGGGVGDGERTRHQVRSQRAYLGDVKTRGAGSGAPVGAAFRPTLLQLMLYRLMLGQMAAGAVDFEKLAAKYKLEADEPFSDSLLAQLGALNQGYFDAVEHASEALSQPRGSQDALDALLEHNSPRLLWDYLVAEAREILAGGEGLGDVLKAEYRRRETGEIFAVKTFLYDEDLLTAYLSGQLKWWRGEREPVGVPPDEAFKCRSCEFAEDCEWRLAKLEEAAAAHRERTRSRV